MHGLRRKHCIKLAYALDICELLGVRLEDMLNNEYEDPGKWYPKKERRKRR